MIFTRAAYEPAHSYGCDSWLKLIGTAGINPYGLSVCAGDCGVIILLGSDPVMNSPTRGKVIKT